jgi:phage protein U
MQLSKQVLIDVSEDASNSTGVQTDGLLLSGIVFPATMTGANVTFDFSFDGSTWVDVAETNTQSYIRRN